MRLRNATWAVVTGLGCAVCLAAESPTSQPVLEFRPILSPAQKHEAAQQLIDRFVVRMNVDKTISAQAKAAVTEEWKKHRDDEDPEGFLQAGLAIVSEPYKKAMTALEEEKYADASAALKPLVESPDAYLSLYARGLLARSLVEQDLLEDAQKVLEPLAAAEKDLMEKTFLETEVDFLLAYAQLANLHYDAALQSFETFEYQHPDAPDRFRLPARQMLKELQARRPDNLGDISDLMVYSSRKLATGEPGQPVQVKQEKAINLLTKLIADAEEQEQQKKSGGSKSCKECKGKGCSKCQGGPPKGANQPKSPANKSALPEGPGEIGELHRSAAARPGDEWGKMRPEERERVLQSLRRSFPSRYRQLVEQYYKQLAKEK